MASRKRYATEHEEQMAVMDWCSAHRGKWPELSLIFAIPNGGHRHKAVAGKLKDEGVKSGVPDLFMPLARGIYHGLFIELKRFGGRVSPIQRAWLQQLMKQGYWAVPAEGADSAIEWIKWYLRGAK